MPLQLAPSTSPPRTLRSAHWSTHTHDQQTQHAARTHRTALHRNRTAPQPHRNRTAPQPHRTAPARAQDALRGRPQEQFALHRQLGPAPTIPTDGPPEKLLAALSAAVAHEGGCGCGALRCRAAGCIALCAQRSCVTQALQLPAAVVCVVWGRRGAGEDAWGGT